MSGESGRSSRPSVGQQVRPEPVVEKTFVESVAGFINEVAPQTYSNPSHYEGKESIIWVRFDYCDINDLARFRDKIEVNGNSPPLLLTVGYTCGVQAWVIPVNGEAMEVLSWRQGAVRTLKILPSPATSASTVDHYSLKRPIIALCDTAGPGPHFCSVSFISLKTGEQVKIIKFKHPVHDIQANKNVVVIIFLEKLAVFDAATLEDTFTVTTCYPCPGPSVNPIALGDRWLAYADRRLVPLHQSCGGMVPEGSTSYKAKVFDAAKSLTKGLKELSESVASNLMGQRAGGLPPTQQAPPANLPTPGIVTVIDTQSVEGGELSLSSTSSSSGGVVAHFCSHQGAPVVALAFDPTGMLLLSADKLGHNFHLYRLQPHPLSSAQTAVHHLYTLHRGDTTAKVTDISFSLDSRWVAVSTHRGTTHVFPITPYGGNIGVRTHTSTCVVNRLSRFHRSAGLDDTPSSGRNSPVLSASPSSSKFAFEVSPNLAYPNPRYPPYPTPTIVRPLVQLRQPLLHNLIGTMGTGPSPSRSPPSGKSPRSPSGDDIIKVASVFGSPRGWVAGSPTVARDKQRRTIDSLFVMAYHGNLLEYHLEPSPAPTLPQDKISEDSPIQLQVHASAQWALVRESTSGELRPPLDITSPLLAPLSPTRPRSLSPAHSLDHDDPEERWMAQVEIHTHAGPHRRLWMGPQFTFKTMPGVNYSSSGSGGGGGVGHYESTAMSASPLEHPPRSSPVNMPGFGGANVLIEAGSLTGSHDQSPRMLERNSGDSDNFDPETMMTQLRHDLADAMMDAHNPGHRSDTGGGSTTSHEARSQESALDMTDVMDISCDPPGPSSGRVSSPSVVASRPASHVGEEVQGITNRLYQVPVTPSSSARASPHIQRTPSLEDTRALTSSAEELSTTLGPGIKVADSVWVPIERPTTKSSTFSPEFVEVDRPEAVQGRGERVDSISPREARFSAIHRPSNTTNQEQTVATRQSTLASPNTTMACEPSAFLGSERLKPTSGSLDLRQSSRHSYERRIYQQSTSPSVALSVAEKSDYVMELGSSSLASDTEENVNRVKTGRKFKEQKGDTVENVWKTYNAPAISQTSQEGSYPSLDKSSTPISDRESGETQSKSRSKTKMPPSTTASEDDLWTTTEGKKDQKKKKKRKSKTSSQEECEPHSQLDASYSSQGSDKPGSISKNQDYGIRSLTNYQILSKEPDVEPPSLEIDVDVDYFHAAEEYHEHPLEEKVEEFDDIHHQECFLEPQVEELDFQEAQEMVVQTLEDFELHADEEEKEAESKEAKVGDSGCEEAMLRSLHDDNDLARALEEAYSSDDTTPAKPRPRARTHSRSRPTRTSEMFPFKDDTSEDEEREVWVRRRAVVSATVTITTTAADETSTDDRGETSGDDRGESSTDDRRTATSESDVGASPNTRATSSTKAKKKKKKKR